MKMPRVFDFTTESENSTYNPYLCMYHGPEFKIEAGESILVIPYGSNKTYNSYLGKFDKKFMRNRIPSIICLLITNEYVDALILVPNKCLLSTLLESDGINHTLGYCSPKELYNIQKDGNSH